MIINFPNHPSGRELTILQYENNMLDIYAWYMFLSEIQLLIERRRIWSTGCQNQFGNVVPNLFNVGIPYVNP